MTTMLTMMAVVCGSRHAAGFVSLQLPGAAHSGLPALSKKQSQALRHGMPPQRDRPVYEHLGEPSAFVVSPWMHCNLSNNIRKLPITRRTPAADSQQARLAHRHVLGEVGGGRQEDQDAVEGVRQRRPQHAVPGRDGAGGNDVGTVLCQPPRRFLVGQPCAMRGHGGVAPFGGTLGCLLRLGT
jgi:hypothetical protein